MHKYFIKKGNHYSELLPKFHWGKTFVAYQFVMYENCYWGYPRNNDDHDLNKLCGISFGYHFHNSIRIGWVSNFTQPDKIDIYSYYYNNKKREMQYLTTIGTGIFYHASIQLLNGTTASIIFDGIEYSFPYNKPKAKWGYYLHPYFGGDNTAPQDLTIKLNQP